jgi:GT2 family glycosyltransferase
MTKITASIVVYNTEVAELDRCISSLLESPINNIYVCDNSPKDSLRQFLSQYERIIYIYNNNNLGYGTAHNIAINKANLFGSEYHLVINSDVYFKQGVIETLIIYMNNNQDVAQVIPNTIYPDGRLQYVCRLLPSPADLIFRRFLPNKLIEDMNYRYLLEFDDHKKEMNIPYHMGCFMFFRMKCFEKVGLFDERFFMYPEDIDITRRMHKYFRTMFYPYVTIAHDHREASYKNKKMLKIHMINMVKYFNKWGWIFDKERKQWNRQILKKLGYKNLKA